MTDNKKSAGSVKQAPSARWERPQLKRLVAGEAEAAGAPVADVVYS